MFHSHGGTLREIEVIARAGSASLDWMPQNCTTDWVELVTAAIDFACRAQGSNGGWTRGAEPMWIGGPDRANATGGMEGAGTVGIGKAFLLLWPQLTTDTLEEAIDDDCDPESAPMPRRTAWSTMFSRAVRFWLDSETEAFSSDPPLPVTLRVRVRVRARVRARGLLPVTLVSQ